MISLCLRYDSMSSAPQQAPWRGGCCCSLRHTLSTTNDRAPQNGWTSHTQPGKERVFPRMQWLSPCRPTAAGNGGGDACECWHAPSPSPLLAQANPAHGQIACEHPASSCAHASAPTVWLWGRRARVFGVMRSPSQGASETQPRIKCKRQFDDGATLATLPSKHTQPVSWWDEWRPPAP